jgi:uncharacterized NAD-dependent epimerase/dehydratase family protein
MSRKIVILAEGKIGMKTSKTAIGIIRYSDDEVVGVIDSTNAGNDLEKLVGVGKGIPIIKNIEESLKNKPDALVIGIAPRGGGLPEEFRDTIKTAIRSGLDIISGLHFFLKNDNEIKELAEKNKVKLIDLREIPENISVAKGIWKDIKAKVLLTVASDCNIGKKTTLLEVYKEFQKYNPRTAFIGTGQTSIYIYNKGIAVDQVIADYVSGAIESEIQKYADDNDFIFVEGQGALTHQGYSAVTLGLMHGTQPDAMILVHGLQRDHDDYNNKIPDLKKLISFHEQSINFFKKSKVIAIGINSFSLSEEYTREKIKEIEDYTGLPADDVIRYGPEKLTKAVIEYFKEQ